MTARNWRWRSRYGRFYFWRNLRSMWPYEEHVRQQMWSQQANDTFSTFAGLWWKQLALAAAGAILLWRRDNLIYIPHSWKFWRLAGMAYVFKSPRFPPSGAIFGVIPQLRIAVWTIVTVMHMFIACKQLLNIGRRQIDTRRLKKIFSGLQYKIYYSHSIQTGKLFEECTWHVSFN